MDRVHLLLWGAAGLAGAVALTALIRYPGEILWKLLKSVVVGCCFVLAVNWIGGYFHYHLPLNPVTALVAGFLGLPGVAALITMQLWLFSG